MGDVLTAARRRARGILVIAVAATAGTGCLRAQAPPEAGDAAATITPEDVLRRVRILAADSMRGRNTPSPELDDAARWIASELREAGVEPGAGDGGYLQRYALRWVRLDRTASVVRAGDAGEWRFGPDVRFAYGPLPTEPRRGTPVLVTGEPGSGDEAADPGPPLRARAVFVAGEVGPDRRLAGTTRRLVRAIRRDDPAAVYVVVPGTESGWGAGDPAGPEPRLVTPRDEDGGVPVVVVREGVAGPFLARHGIDLAAERGRGGAGLRAVAVDGPPVTLDVAREIVREADAPNVVGVLPGSDPRLADEYVLFSAHMDHVGVRGPGPAGDSIYNGADDNASGTTVVMELAEAFAGLDPAPRRSLVFLLVSGEEKGLWGSAYFAEHPTVPLERVVAAVNLDMVGRNWRDTIVAIGKEHSTLGPTLERVNGAHPDLGITAIDDLWPEERFYYRSDHYNFARKGVPILFFFNGVHEDYHRPGDEASKIREEKTARIGRLVFWLGLEVANADDRPRWDRESYREIVDGAGEGDGG